MERLKTTPTKLLMLICTPVKNQKKSYSCISFATKKTNKINNNNYTYILKLINSNCQLMAEFTQSTLQMTPYS